MSCPQLKGYQASIERSHSQQGMKVDCLFELLGKELFLALVHCNHISYSDTRYITWSLNHMAGPNTPISEGKKLLILPKFSTGADHYHLQNFLFLMLNLERQAKNFL